MLIKKEILTESKTVECLFDSSNILSSRYTPSLSELLIYFNSGDLYKYTNVGYSDYLIFENSKSQGVEFAKRIKNKYDFEKVGTYDIDAYLEEINKIKGK